MSMVGKNIDAFCSKCQLTLAHVVLYEMNGVVLGVKCKTCRAEHRYRGPKPPPPKRDVPAERWRNGRPVTASIRPAPKPVRPVDARQWEKRQAAAGQDGAVWAYKLTERYEKGDVIEHPQFGRGFVEAITSGQSMEVLFREGHKQMAMNREPASEKGP
jgi:hypothetical protein